MHPRRIVYVLNIFPKISETFIAGEIAELRRRGIEVRILSLLPPRNEPQHNLIRAAGLDQITSYDLRNFRNIIREFQPDLIHAHFAKEATEKARELSSEFGVPYCFTAHGYDIHRKPPRDFYERAVGARAVITVSKVNAAYIHDRFHVPQSHIHIIPCGVDTGYFCQASKDEVQSAVPRLVCVARHVQVKSLGILLQACALLRGAGVDFRCVMAGDGPLREELLAQRSTLQLDALVEMPGALEQSAVLKLWQQASIGVLTSDNEGMPVCLMEAASCGVPVVATAVGGIPEMVQDGVTGLLCSPGDSQQIAHALKLLIEDAGLRQRMGAAARLRAVQQFSVVRQVDELLRIWTQVLNGVPA